MTEVDDNRPKWLLELENRKRKQRLGHETGAGSPCLSCESACPGLDLHFWRKICKNCKCRGDEHDFDDDEFPQFELLFGSGIKARRGKNRSVLLKVNDKKFPSSVSPATTTGSSSSSLPGQTETPFEWIPPDTSKELAADYMKSLPLDKLPITGSSGAALRKQQLQKQLPLHDFDHKACVGLSDEERQEFDKYLSNIKRCAGQGRVSKFTIIRPFDQSLMTPANATDVQRSSPQHSQQLTSKNPLNGTGPALRTPSSFIPKGLPGRPQKPLDAKVTGELVHNGHPSLQLAASDEYARGGAQKPVPGSMTSAVGNSSPLVTGIDVLRAQQTQTASEESPRLGRYHHALANVSGSGGDLAQASNVPGTYHLAGSSNPLMTTPSKRNDIGTPHGVPVSPYELRYSRNPTSMLADDEKVQGRVAQRIGDSKTSGTTREGAGAMARSENVGGQVERSLEFSNEPPTNYAQLAEQLITKALLPPSAVNAGEIVGSSLDERGLARIREKLSDKYNGNRNDRSMLATNQVACHRDLEHISHNPAMISSSEDIKRSAEIAKEFESQPKNQLDVSAMINQQQQSQSPYQANTERLPVELNVSLPVRTNVVHSESLNNPVFPEEIVGASTVYQNQENINQLQDELQAMKVNAFNRRECTRCEEDIYPGQVVVTADKIEDAVWHPGCFKCCTCNELLADLVYFTYKGKLYCGRDLAKLLEIPRCHACDELIFVREYTVAEGNNYHVKHFCCWDCDTPLANQLYVTENDRPLCLPCYQKYYAKKCNTCNNAIAADQQGVAVKGLDFHANNDCFCCFTCKKSLLGGQIAVRENKLLCSKECIAEFLHRREMGR